MTWAPGAAGSPVDGGGGRARYAWPSVRDVKRAARQGGRRRSTGDGDGGAGDAGGGGGAPALPPLPPQSAPLPLRRDRTASAPASPHKSVDSGGGGSEAGGEAGCGDSCGGGDGGGGDSAGAPAASADTHRGPAPLEGLDSTMRRRLAHEAAGCV